MQAPATPRPAAPDAAPPLESTPVTDLRGVGPAIAAKLAGLGIETVLDLLFHLPLRYEDRTRVRAIGDLSAGDTALTCGRIESAVVRFGRRRSLVVSIGDGTGTMAMRLFHFNENQRRQLRPGRRIACYGEMHASAGGIETAHPEYRLLDDDAEPPTTDRLTPVYPAASGLGQALLRRLTGQALDRLEHGPDVADLLPGELAARHGLAGLVDALRTIHRPPAGTGAEAPLDLAHPARRRLAFEELLAHHLALRLVRRRIDRRHAAPLDRGDAPMRRFVDSLPFELTAAQRRVAREVRADLARTRPMHRLVQGDVGAGKTVVAAIAAVAAVASERQVALMAPTELLAEQHFASFRGWLEPLGIEVVWLSGRLGSRERGRALARIAGGEAAVAVGTHALFQSRRGVRGPRARHRRRAAPLRGRAAARTARQGRARRAAPASAHHDRHPDPAHPRHDRVRRPRRLGGRRAAAGADPGRHRGGVLRAPARGRGPHPPGLRAQASRRTGSAPPSRSPTRSRAAPRRTPRASSARPCPELRVGLVHGRMPPAEKDAAMAAFREGRA